MHVLRNLTFSKALVFLSNEALKENASRGLFAGPVLSPVPAAVSRGRAVVAEAGVCWVGVPKARSEGPGKAARPAKRRAGPRHAAVRGAEIAALGKTAGSIGRGERG